MYYLCMFATCLVLANGWVLDHHRVRRENPEQCITRVLGQCTPAHIPYGPDELFDKNGHLSLDCSDDTLREEHLCADSLASCQSFQSTSFAIMMVVKSHICDLPDVYQSGRTCWNEINSESKALELSVCDQCAEWTCYRGHLNNVTCPDEQLKFMARLNRDVVMTMFGTC